MLCSTSFLASVTLVNLVATIATANFNAPNDLNNKPIDFLTSLLSHRNALLEIDLVSINFLHTTSSPRLPVDHRAGISVPVRGKAFRELNTVVMYSDHEEAH